MKKLLILAVVLLSTTLNVFAQEPVEGYITKSQEYYRGQIDIVEKYSKTNFMKAVANGNTNMVETYIKAGMDPNSTQTKLPATILAIGAKQPAVLETLLKNGADSESETMGITPLMFAINRKNIECVKILVANNANINHAFKDVTPLYLAVAKKQYDIAKFLIASGAEINNDIILKTFKSKDEDLKQLVIEKAAAQKK